MSVLHCPPIAGPLLWLGAGVLLALLDRPLWDRIWILTLGLWAAYAFGGLVLLVQVLRAGKRQHWPRSLVATAVAVPICALALWLAFPLLAHAGDALQFQRRFRSLQPEYEAIIRTVAHQPQAAQEGEMHGITYRVDPGPPLRVAFPQPGGILDNWEAVIYDPTGAARSASGWRDGIPGSYSARSDVVKIFGGDLVECRHIVNSFYRCWFT